MIDKKKEEIKRLLEILTRIELMSEHGANESDACDSIWQLCQTALGSKRPTVQVELYLQLHGE